MFKRTDEPTKKEIAKPGPLAATLFNQIFKDSDWTELIVGKEWRKCADLIVKAAGQTSNRPQEELEDWVKKQKVDLEGESPLVELGDRWIDKLDREMADRNLIAFDLSTYALRQALEELYSRDESPFDVSKKRLLARLKAVNTHDALRSYVDSYLRQLVRYLLAGYVPGDKKEERERDRLLRAVEGKEVSRLADQFLNSLEQFSKEKGGAGEAVSKRLRDVPKWLDWARTTLSGKGEQ